ncbi:copper-binding protein [Bradyrhizobium sp. WSM 1791]|uniref:Copper-binding protein n=2 Tax=Bradyrhizobium australiense TaxID=2721161 RepID=A0A7Y4GYL9_9BRAD|nr:copper-binding protein [Bradyrhizobium australiense]
MTKFTHAVAAAMFAAILSLPAHAQGDAVQGEVKKIDETAGKITLKHGPIKNLGMDQGMTMVFRVNDPAVLKQVKVGDKVEFEAENGSSGYTVTKIQKSR